MLDVALLERPTSEDGDNTGLDHWEGWAQTVFTLGHCNWFDERTVRRCHISCLDQDIFTAIFAIEWLQSGLWELEPVDLGVLEPLTKHLHKLVPWLKWQR